MVLFAMIIYVLLIKILHVITDLIKKDKEFPSHSYETDFSEVCTINKYVKAKIIKHYHPLNILLLFKP